MRRCRDDTRTHGAVGVGHGHLGDGEALHAGVQGLGDEDGASDCEVGLGGLEFMVSAGLFVFPPLGLLTMSGAPPRYADVPTPSRIDESVTNDCLRVMSILIAPFETSTVLLAYTLL